MKYIKSIYKKKENLIFIWIIIKNKNIIVINKIIINNKKLNNSKSNNKNLIFRSNFIFK
jgi:hypothetical protein